MVALMKEFSNKVLLQDQSRIFFKFNMGIYCVWSTVILSKDLYLHYNIHNQNKKIFRISKIYLQKKKKLTR